MLKVGTLIKYLSENNTDQSFQEAPARLAFFNYLSNLCALETEVTVELLENFFATFLDYAHWQQNRASLGQEVRDLLGGNLDLSNIRWPEETQLVELEQQSDLTDALQFYLNSLYKKGEKYRLILEPDKKVIAIVLMPDHSVCVRSFDRKMIVRHGQLEPLKKDFALFYTPDLELDPTQMQKIEIAPFVTAQFQLASAGLQGCLVKGYLGQKFFDLKGPGVSAYPKLFYAVKRLEQHFLNRQTDPFYQETISALERSIDHVRLGDPEAIQNCTDVMARAQNAYEYVFAGDKLMSLLIRDLQHTLDMRNTASRSDLSAVVRTPQKVEKSWKQPLNQRIQAKTQLLHQRTTPADTQPTQRTPRPTTQPMFSRTNLRTNPMEREMDLTQEEGWTQELTQDLTEDLTLDPNPRRMARKSDLTN